MMIITDDDFLDLIRMMYIIVIIFTEFALIIN